MQVYRYIVGVINTEFPHICQDRFPGLYQDISRAFVQFSRIFSLVGMYVFHRITNLKHIICIFCTVIITLKYFIKWHNGNGFILRNTRLIR